MSSYLEIALAAFCFIASHSLPARPAWRRVLVERLGRRLYLGLYAALSLALLAWLVDAVLHAPPVVLWALDPWSRWVPLLAMPPACLLLLGGLAAPNPLSVSLSRKPFDPARPGIVALTRHPVLWGFALWAVSHLFPNGTLAALLLFGSSALFSVFGMALSDRRARRSLGAEAWARLAAEAPLLPRPGRAAWRDLPLLPALGLYAGLLILHPLVIGRWPLPY